MCLAKSDGMGQQQQQGAMLTGVVYAVAAAQLMKMIYVSSVHQATNTANIDLDPPFTMIMSAYTSITKSVVSAAFLPTASSLLP